MSSSTLDGSGQIPPAWHKAVGISLALASSAFIGMSFVFKKRGLIESNALGDNAANDYAYLRNGMWWTGMILSLFIDVVM